MDSNQYYNENNEASGKPAARGASLKKLVRENKFYTLVLIFMFFGIPIFNISEINDLDSGKVQHARLIFPTGMLYTVSGYWAAVLFYPVCQVLLISFILFRFIIRRGKR